MDLEDFLSKVNGPYISLFGSIFMFAISAWKTGKLNTKMQFREEDYAGKFLNSPTTDLGLHRSRCLSYVQKVVRLHA